MPQTAGAITFGPFRLDTSEGQLWRGAEPIALQPRPLAVLSYLAARPSLTVSRDELIAKLWGRTHVTKAVLKVAVRAIREALDDDAEAPRYIETVEREGYRFVGAGVAGARAPSGMPRSSGEVGMVGRADELATLHGALTRATGGERGMVFVTGEAGIGKTTLLDRFVAQIDRSGGTCVARGQCLEQYGGGEAYLPILEALGRLARDGEAAELSRILAQHAPTWVPQLAALDPGAATRRSGGGGMPTMPVRMLREMADALEIFASERTLVLLLEDLQWSDPSTVDLLGYIARRRQPARLLVVGSLRPVDMVVGGHPMRSVQHELQAKGLCEEIALELLSAESVATYVEARFDGIAPATVQRLAARVHDRTEGNALFMVNMTNDLVAGGLLVQRDGAWHIDGSIEDATDRVPTGLQELIGRSMQALAPETRQALEAASVVGDEFAVAAVAAALRVDADSIEDVCEQLAAQGSLIVDAGVAEWPDESVSGRYRFRHALYRRVLYQGIAAARRARLHDAVGQRLESAYGRRAEEHAAELAMHFTRGRAHTRALQFHELACRAALDRYALHEAVAHCNAALEALAHGADESERTQHELELVVMRATLLMAIKGYGAAETEQAFAQACLLCDALPAGPQRYAVLRGLISFHQVRAELRDAHRFGEQLLRYAASHRDDAVLVVQAHYGQGTTLFHRGELDAARTHLEAALGEYDATMHRRHVLIYGGYDPGVACSMWLAWTQIFQGEIDAAVVCDREALALAERHADLFSLAYAHYAAGVTQQLQRNWPASGVASALAAQLAEEHGFPHLLGMATANHGWALVMQGQTAAGIPRLREGVGLVERTGALLVHPLYLGMLAGAHAFEGDRQSALARFDEALAEVERDGERVHEPTLLIGKAQLLIMSAQDGSSRLRTTAAEECLRRAIEVARGQGARLLQLRAALALAQLYLDRGRGAEARAPLASAYEWFSTRPSAVAEIATAGELLGQI